MPADDVERRERDHEARDPPDRRQRPVHDPARDADADADEERDHDRGRARDPVQVAEHRPRRVGGQAEHGADRQVDVPRDDDHRLAEREQGQDRPVAEDDVDLLAAEEPRLHRGRDDDQQDERGDDPVGAQAEDEVGQPHRPHAAMPGSALRAVDGRHQAASCCELTGRGGHDRLLGCLVVGELGDEPALAHDEDPVGDAQHLGQLGRDHQDRDPLAGQLVEQPVHLRLRADVDAARGLVDEQQRRTAAEPLGEHDLLLVPARERGRRVRELPVLELKPLSPVGGEAALRRREDEPEMTEPPQRRERDVARRSTSPSRALAGAGPPARGRPRRPSRAVGDAFRRRFPLTVTEPAS